MSIKQYLPWQVKIAAKIILSRIPSGYHFWQRLNLFKHGGMEQPEYALSVFLTHFNRVDFANKSSGFTALEIGPGDTLFSAMIARAYGARQCYLIDVGRFARDDIEPYRKMASELKRRGLDIPGIEESASLDALLSVCRSRYLTEGLRSFGAIPDGSIDFIWSQAVLEHI
ncbi:MAG: methyltransferase, partial [Ktedonobacteraceae bacterium]